MECSHGLFRCINKICKKQIWTFSCLSVHLPAHMEQLSSHWMDFHEILYMSIFWISVEKIQVSLKSDKNNGYFTLRPRYIFLRMKNVSDKSYRQNQNTHFMLNNFFWKSCCLWDNVEKCCRARYGTDDKMGHLHCMLDI